MTSRSSLTQLGCVQLCCTSSHLRHCVEDETHPLLGSVPLYVYPPSKPWERGSEHTSPQNRLSLRQVVAHLSVTAFKPLHFVIHFMLVIGERVRPSRFGRAKMFDPTYDGSPRFTPRIQARPYPTCHFVRSRLSRRTMINAVLRRYQ